MTGPSRRRWLRIAAVVGFPAVGAAIACTAGEDIAYQSSPITGDGGVDGPVADGGGRIVGDSTIDVRERTGDSGGFPPSMPFKCTGLDPDAGCDPTAGLGCCLAAASDPVGTGNKCFEQREAFEGTQCAAAKDVFIACLSSDSDNTCCWHKEANNTTNTRYRAACDGGVEACDPTADGGGVCAMKAKCNAVTCKGVVVGYCGEGSSPCTPD